MMRFYFLLFIIFSCTKSDSNEKVLTDVDNSTKPEIFGEWSPAFSNQINNFIQKRSGNKGTEETREITIDSIEEVVKSKEGDTDINQDGDYYDITTQTILT